MTPRALAARGLLDPASVQEIRTGQGNLDIANDLVALCASLGASWAKIENKTAATAEEVHRAGDLGPLLLAALGVREHGSGEGAAPAEPAAGAEGEKKSGKQGAGQLTASGNWDRLDRGSWMLSDDRDRLTRGS